MPCQPIMHRKEKWISLLYKVKNLQVKNLQVPPGQKKHIDIFQEHYYTLCFLLFSFSFFFSPLFSFFLKKKTSNKDLNHNYRILTQSKSSPSWSSGLCRSWSSCRREISLQIPTSKWVMSYKNVVPIYTYQSWSLCRQGHM